MNLTKALLSDVLQCSTNPFPWKILGTILMLPFYNRPSRSLHTTLRHYVKRKYPINRDDGAPIPVFQYPASTKSDRRVYIWGLAEHGALGNHLDRRVVKKRAPRYLHHPSRLHFAEQHKVTDVACGYGFTAFAIDTKDKYKVYGSGINSDSQLGVQAPRLNHPLGLVLSPAPIALPLINPTETKVSRLAAGRAHLLVLTDQEGVYSLGNNAYGQCGRLIINSEEYKGSEVVHHIPNLAGVSIRDIECGQDHSLFLSEKGEVYACGWGADGQTGLGHYESEWQPTKVRGDIEGENIIKVSTAADCVLALNDKGEVFGWGNSEYGQLPVTSENQQQNAAIHVKKCQALGRVVDMAAGGSFCIVVNDVGDVFVWGYGILGKGPNVHQAAEPIQIPRALFGGNEFEPDMRVVAVSSGISHLAAITSHGNLYMWGRNRGGCLGLGHIKDQFFPLKVAIGARVKKISCGVDHTVAFCQPFV